MTLHTKMCYKTMAMVGESKAAVLEPVVVAVGPPFDISLSNMQIFLVIHTRLL